MKKDKLYMIIGIVVLVISIMGSSYASYKVLSEKNAIVNANVCTPNIVFMGGATINGNKLKPTLTKEEGVKKNIDVKISKDCDSSVTMNLYMRLDKFPVELKDNSFKYAVYKNSNTLVKEGNLGSSNEGDVITIATDETISTTNSTYTVYVWIDGSVDNPGTMADKSFKFVLWGEGNGAIYKENVMAPSTTAYSDTSKFLNTDLMRKEINSITVKGGNTVPEGVISKDISSLGDGSVMLWYEESSTAGLYDVTIGGAGMVQTTSNASSLFAYLTNVKKIDLSALDTSNTTNMNSMFYNCSKLTSLDLSSFDTSKVIDMSNMFSYCDNLNSLNISSFNTSNVTDMSNMFSNCGSLMSLDLSNFDTSNVYGMSGMFSDCSILTSLDLSGFKTDNVTDMTVMFSNCSGLLSLDLSSFDTPNLTGVSAMFYGCTNLITLNLGNLNVSQVMDMSNMFAECSSLVSLDLSSFDTSNARDMNNMFYNCSSLVNLNLSGFNTSEVYDMSNMFDSCSSLTSLDLSSFNTSNVVSMDYMFSSNSNLKTIYASGSWIMSNVESSTDMFADCTSLVGTVSYDSTKIDGTMANYTTGYLTLKG